MTETRRKQKDEIMTTQETQQYKYPNVDAALAAAQGRVTNAVKNAKNPHLKNRYADLGSIIEATKGVMAECGLAVTTIPSGIGPEGVTFETSILHESGTRLGQSFVMPLAKRDAQALGGAITYARRYCLAAWLNISHEDDDDGNAASESPPKAVKTFSQLAAAIAGAGTPALLEALKADIRALGESDAEGAKELALKFKARKAELGGA